ncbi:hypothetical protein BDF21DRAFT_401618 [Thamnidium elegans]|nr:hypothetical protein BDF21DRAFT_401618 [Thamnidium elegans]
MKDSENNVGENEESIEGEKNQESEEESQDDDKEESQEGDKEEITYGSIYQDFRYYEANERKSQDLKFKFENNFNIMREEDKWYLSTGKCVEDELYAFGMQRVEGHPSHSFIIDISDKNYTKYNVFSNNELNKIKSYNTRKDLEWIYLYTTADEIRREISKPQEFDQGYNQYKDDIAFDNLENIDVLRTFLTGTDNVCGSRNQDPQAIKITRPNLRVTINHNSVTTIAKDYK